MNTAEMMLAIEDEDGPVAECSAAEFLRDNADGLTDLDRIDVCVMLVGESLRFGGGAAPAFTVERVR